CCFFHCSPALPDLPSFPTRRSSDLFRTSAGHEPAREADTVPFGTYRRRVFERIGLFNPNMVRHQDYEFNFRLRSSGGRILLLPRSEEHTSELQSRSDLVCRLLLEKK